MAIKLREMFAHYWSNIVSLVDMLHNVCMDFIQSKLLFCCFFHSIFSPQWVNNKVKLFLVQIVIDNCFLLHRSVKRDHLRACPKMPSVYHMMILDKSDNWRLPPSPAQLKYLKRAWQIKYNRLHHLKARQISEKFYSATHRTSKKNHP